MAPVSRTSPAAQGSAGAASLKAIASARDPSGFVETDIEFATGQLSFAASGRGSSSADGTAITKIAARVTAGAVTVPVALFNPSLPALVLQTGHHPGSAVTLGLFRLGFSTNYTETTTVQLTKWIMDAQSIAGFRITGRVDAGGSASLEHDWTIASLGDVPVEKGTVDHRSLHGNATIFTSYADFTASTVLASTWNLSHLPGRAAANLLDLTFPGAVATSYIPFPHAPGFGLAEPDTWETAGNGQDSANFELNGNYTDWFAPGGPAALHDEIDFTWEGAARAATLQLSLLQTLGSKHVFVELLYQGRLVYAGSPVPISPTGKFQAGNPSIATINLANLLGANGRPLQLLFDELRLQSACGGFLVNGLALTMADNTTTSTGGRDMILSADPAARSTQILYNAPAPITFGGTGAAAQSDGVLDIRNFDLERGDQIVMLKTDLVHLQITPTNGNADLALRFLNDPQSLILLRGGGSLDVAGSFHELTVGGTTEVVVAKLSGT